ncbi:MAG TPA: ABC transporter permease [Mycobacteriales bacterium]|nr:ABC transporter permease [Mycobacteriales bacterium]
MTERTRPGLWPAARAAVAPAGPPVGPAGRPGSPPAGESTGRRSARPRLLVLVSQPDAAALAALLAATVAFGLFARGFATIDNFRSILISVAIVACMALGENLVILAGEIDVSVGSTLALAGFVAGPIAVDTDNIWLTLAVGVGVGLLGGLINGLVVAYTRVPSIVATLGTLYAYQGLALLWSHSKNVVSVPEGASVLGAGRVHGFPTPALVVLVAFVLLTLWRRNTNVGRDLIAVGANRQAARTMGVRIRAELILAFLLCGTLAGLAAVLYLGEVGGIQTSVVGTNLVLQVIAACAIGGTSIQGGRGTDLAPLIGALLVGVITSGVVVLGVPGVWFPCVYGGFILLAVARDRLWQPRVVS